MSAVAFFVAIAAWGSVFWRPHVVVRVCLFLLFGLLGMGFTLAGGFAYWWDSSMMPDQASPFVFIWGLLTLGSQLVIFLRDGLGDGVVM